MKQTKISVLLASLMAAGFMMSGQAMAAEDSATTTVTILAPITVSDTQNMSFGTVVRDTISKTVTETTPAIFTVGGTVGATYSFAITATDLTGGGGDPMPLSAFTAAKGATPLDGSEPNFTSTLGNATEDVTVGATLTVGAEQVAGTYTGTITATVNYN